MDYTEDKILGGRVTLFQPRKGYRVAIDPVLLAAAIPAQKGQRVLDMGCGTGAVSLCLQARVGGLEIDGFDINPEHIELAVKSAAANRFEYPCRFTVRDVTEWKNPILYDFVVANPPFFDEKAYSNSPYAGKSAAHATSDLESWIACARRNLAENGSFIVIFPTDRLEILKQSIYQHFSSISLFYVQSKFKIPPNRVILTAKGQKSAENMLFETGSILVHAEAGGYTPEAEEAIRNAKAINMDAGIV